MTIDIRSSTATLISNLALQPSALDSATPAATSSQQLLQTSASTAAPSADALSSAFNEMLQLFKTFIGAMRDMGLLPQSADSASATDDSVGSADSTDGSAAANTATDNQTAQTAGTTAADAVSVPNASLQQLNDTLKGIQTSLDSLVSNFTARSSKVLKQVTGLFNKVTKLVKGKDAKSIVSSALNLVKSLF